MVRHDPQSDDTPTDTPNVADTIVRLAGLPLIEYDRFREKEAKACARRHAGRRNSALAAAVRDWRRGNAAVLFDELEPWRDSVEGAALLDAIADTFARYLVLPAGAAGALVLWTAHTHVYDAFEHTPRLNVTAPQKQCGKMMLLDILQTVVAKGLRAENVTTAVLFRITDKDAPTLLIDECGSFSRDNKSYAAR